MQHRDFISYVTRHINKQNASTLSVFRDSRATNSNNLDTAQINSVTTVNQLNVIDITEMFCSQGGRLFWQQFYVNQRETVAYINSNTEPIVLKKVFIIN